MYFFFCQCSFPADFDPISLYPFVAITKEHEWVQREWKFHTTEAARVQGHWDDIMIFFSEIWNKPIFDIKDSIIEMYIILFILLMAI